MATNSNGKHFLFLFLNFFNVYLFLRERERERERQSTRDRGAEREIQNPKQAPGSVSTEPDVGLKPMNCGTKSDTQPTELKSDAQPTEPPRQPTLSKSQILSATMGFCLLMQLYVSLPAAFFHLLPYYDRKSISLTHS